MLIRTIAFKESFEMLLLNDVLPHPYYLNSFGLGLGLLNMWFVKGLARELNMPLTQEHNLKLTVFTVFKELCWVDCN